MFQLRDDEVRNLKSQIVISRRSDTLDFSGNPSTDDAP
jgi:hypothetical protein